MNFIIATFCGLIAYGLVMWGLFKAMKNADRIETFLEKCGFKISDGISSVFWNVGFPLLFLFTVVGLVQKFVWLMNWLTR